MFLISKLSSLRARPAQFTLKNRRNSKTYQGEILPSSTRKIFKANPAKTKPKQVAIAVDEGPRLNELDIQMLPKNIHSALFEGLKPPKIDPETIRRCKAELEKHSMTTKKEDHQPEIDFKIPPLAGTTLEDHFYRIGEEQSKPYRDLVLKLIESEPPARPPEWLLQPGWVRYVPGFEPQPIAYPHEDCLVFDVEVCMSAGKAPTVATAMSRDAWYSWVSPAVIDGTSRAVTSHQYSPDSLIPMESEADSSILTEHMRREKVIVGHNVSYDRARIREQYYLEQTGTRFVDTMSLHVCVSGLTSFQRAVLKSGRDNGDDSSWKEISSLNSLLEVYKLYCGKVLEKETRDIFTKGTVGDVKDHYPEVMRYCSGDVLATFEVLRILFRLFLERFPHPVTFAGMLELGTAYLPVNGDTWNRYVSDSEQTFEDLSIESKVMLARRADNACQLLHGQKFREDLWMWDLDWDVKELKMKKKASLTVKTGIDDNSEEEEEEDEALKKKFLHLWETASLLPSKLPLLPGYPNWYRKLCTKPDSEGWVPGPRLISTSMQVTPKLLSLTWEGYPLHYIRDKGWGFLVPFTDDLEELPVTGGVPLRQLIERCPLLIEKPEQPIQETMNNINRIVQENLMKKEYYSRLKLDKTHGLYKGTGVWSGLEIDNCCWFFKLPHKDGASYNVGNPMAKDFLNKFSESVLAGDTESAEHVLRITRMLSYWRNNRDRIFDQMIVWLDPRRLPRSLRDNSFSIGAILPQVVVSGTLTRRAVEPTWMTASNAHPERVGSELRAMIQAPPGFSIVGADVDSQELWIASILGDSHHAGVHGATPFGWMTLSGTKGNETDMHSVTAKAVGISREHAKVLNYSRIYGAGQNFAERLLKQFNPSMSEGEARKKASRMFSFTKGKRLYHLKPEYLLELPDQAYSKWQAFGIAKNFGKKIGEMFESGKWVGGTESAMFNRLEEIANSPSPRTPFLDCRLSRAVEPGSMSDNDAYLPTKINWVVQSGAVDFLHLMLVCMRWIMRDRARFCLSFHDEVRYLVADEHKYKAALAMHVTNLLTRSFCASRLGLNDLPLSVAFFSSVEVDTVLRKDAKHDYVTPSNPHGLQNGYGIRNGESLDVYEAVEKAGGRSARWFDRRK